MYIVGITHVTILCNALSPQVDLLHPLTELQWEKCSGYTGGNVHNNCAVLNNKLAMLAADGLFDNDTLHVSSTDLKSWTTITLPYKYMSLTTYKSQFVAVGGMDISTKQPIDTVFTSDTGLKWQISLPPMKTKRYLTSCISTRSPHVLVVAGGIDCSGEIVDVVEVLQELNWHTVDPLPEPCCDMTATLHQDEVVFTDSISDTIFKCNYISLISSDTGSTTTSGTPLWTFFTAPDIFTTTISYSSRLVNIDSLGCIRCYCTMSQSLIEVFRIPLSPESNFTSVTSRRDVAVGVLPTGHLIFFSNVNGVYKMKASSE